MSTMTWITEKELERERERARESERERETGRQISMKEKDEKMKLNASGHQRVNEQQLKKFNYCEQKHIQHFLHNTCY